MNKEKLKSGLIPSDTHAEMVKNRHAKNMAHLLADRQKWFYATVFLSLLSAVLAFGWHKADKRFAENVRVAWVKMYANGHTDTEIAENEKPVDFFMTTVESKLSEWTEKRFSKRKETILTDYGFAKMMMGEEMKVDFTENFNAAEVAAKFIACTECLQITAKVREIQLWDKDKIEGTRNKQQYTALVFTTEQSRSKEGKIVSCENKIITILWTFRPMGDVVNRRDELRYNPLGQDLIRADYKNDPTPIDLNNCKKL
jgi:hypothetical protein